MSSNMSEHEVLAWMSMAEDGTLASYLYATGVPNIQIQYENELRRRIRDRK